MKENEYNELLKNLFFVCKNYEANMYKMDDCFFTVRADQILELRSGIDFGKDTFRSYPIKNDIAETAGVEKEQFIQDVLANTWELFPPELHSMDEVLQIDVPDFPGVVMTNTKKIYGATCMWYPGYLKNCAKGLADDLYILPSSIHECILMRASLVSDEKELNSLVQFVNETEVADEEILANHAYYYSKEKNEISIVE